MAIPVHSDLPTSDLPTSDLLTVDEVAALLRLSRMTVYRLIHDGHLAALHIGRSYRVTTAAVDDLLRSSALQ